MKRDTSSNFDVFGVRGLSHSHHSNHTVDLQCNQVPDDGVDAENLCIVRARTYQQLHKVFIFLTSDFIKHDPEGKFFTFVIFYAL